MTTNVLHLDSPAAATLSVVAAANIKAELAYLGRRHGDLAGALGVSSAAVSMKLRGERAISLDELEPIAEYLGVTVFELLTPRGQRPGPISPRAVQPTDYSGSNVISITSRERRETSIVEAGDDAPLAPVSMLADAR